jgi:hypothetical protein
MKKIILLSFLFTLISCKKEDVQLPKTNVSVLKEINDYSSIYIFFKVEEKDTIADLNRNNSIATTNWVYNIDKRLTLDLVIPEIIQMQKKKKNSSHKKEDAIDVFSYADSIGNNLAFLPFTGVEYKYDDKFSKFFVKENANLYMDYLNLGINFNKDNKITVDGSEIEREDLIAFVKDFADFTSNGKTTILHLNFDKHLTYEQYIQNKILAWQITSDKIQISSYEFIYDLKKLPECGCKL